MKKLLAIFGSLAFCSVNGLTAISCGTSEYDNKDYDPIEPDEVDKPNEENVLLNISTINLPEFIMGGNYEYFINQAIENFQNALSLKSSPLKLNEDFIIADQTDKLTHAGFVWFIALDSSQKINGKIKIEVKPKYIYDLRNSNLQITLDEAFEIDDLLISYINEKYFNGNENINLQATDFEIYNQDGENANKELKTSPKVGNYTVKSTSNSLLINGWFTFEVYKKTNYNALLRVRQEALQLINQANENADITTLKTAIADAEIVLYNNPNASQKMVNEMVIKLSQAIKDFQGQ